MKPANRSMHCAANGFTLIEVMLSIAILAILAFLAVSALSYPKYMVITSGVEQSAIHAASAELERHLYNYQYPIPAGEFNTDGWPVTITTATNLITEVIPGTGNSAEYAQISTTVVYRDGKSVDLITYRAHKVSPGVRHP